MTIAVDSDTTGHPAGPARRPLAPSVITSSSGRRLAELLPEVCSACPAGWFDLYVLRECDVWDIENVQGTPLFPANTGPAWLDNRTATQIMSEPENIPHIVRWINTQFRTCPGARIACFATYFPEISSRAELPKQSGGRTRYQLATAAITNTLDMALSLDRDILAGPVFMEIVAGTILDICGCPACTRETIFVSARERKIRLLCESLVKVVEAIEKRHAGRDWHLGVELEPGPTYLLNDVESLETFFKVLDNEFPGLRGRVGLNVDIAHMKIAQVEPTRLARLSNRFIHAHISDHPGMHTRDQPVGRWNIVERQCGMDFPYLRQLWEQMDRKDPLPFSGAVALELEGCNRFSWILESLANMRRIFDAVMSQEQSRLR